MIKKKVNKGFSLIELIVVISVLALLALGSVVAFQGIQNNARRTTLSSDANALVGALNNYNVQVREGDRISGITRFNSPANTLNTHDPIEVDEYAFTITVTVPAQGVRGAEPTVIAFESLYHMNRAVSVIDFTNGRFRVNTDWIAGASREQLSDAVGRP